MAPEESEMTPKHSVTSWAGRQVRRTLPALGLVTAAMSGYSSQSSTGASLTALDPVPPLTVELITQEATLLHYARAQGVGDGLREAGTVLPEPLEARMSDVAMTVEGARTGRTAHKIDLAYSEGRLDAEEGSWSADALANYVRTIDFTQAGIREIADRSTLHWEAELGLERARGTVRTALAVALTEFAEVTDLPSLNEGMGLAVLAHVSGRLRPLLGHLEDTAFGPPETGLPPGFFTDPPVTEHASNDSHDDQPEI